MSRWLLQTHCTTQERLELKYRALRSWVMLTRYHDIFTQKALMLSGVATDVLQRRHYITSDLEWQIVNSLETKQFDQETANQSTG